MTIEKKSLISSINTTKKAIVATAPSAEGEAPAVKSAAKKSPRQIFKPRRIFKPRQIF